MVFVVDFLRQADPKEAKPVDRRIIKLGIDVEQMHKEEDELKDESCYNKWAKKSQYKEY